MLPSENLDEIEAECQEHFRAMPAYYVQGILHVTGQAAVSSML